MNTVYYDGKPVRIDPQQPLGEGGEAIVYDIGGGKVLKIYRQPDDPYYRDNPDAEQAKRDQAGARQRLQAMQSKLRDFPKAWSPRVVTPLGVVTNRSGSEVLGYGMPLIGGTKVLRDFAKRKTRPPGFDNNAVLQVFRDLHPTVALTHAAGVVIGDFNYFNVLVKLSDKTAYLIDADSMQFAKYYCRLFTPRFVDPLICEPLTTPLVQIKPHSVETDWYAYALMLFEAMMLTPVYGGVYEPGKGKIHVELDARPHHRISVMYPGVIYPTAGVPLKMMDDDFLHYYERLVTKDHREQFPGALLEKMRWTTCSQCGIEHAKARCPNCAQAAPQAAVKMLVRGKVRMLRVFDTSGVILRAAVSEGALHVLYHHNNAFQHAVAKWSDTQKEFAVISDSKVIDGSLEPNLRFGLQGDKSVLAAPGRMFVFSPRGTAPEQISCENFRDEAPSFAANSDHLYWAYGGELMRSDERAPKNIGKTLAGQTRFWVGSKFGFGFYRVGAIQVAFVFDAERQGINDNVVLPPMRGQIIEANCVFDDHRCWFFASTRDGGVVTNHVFVIGADGRVTASLSVPETESSWLNDIGGRCSATLARQTGGAVHVLFAITDRGIIRVHEENGALVEAARFPDTEGLVQTGDELLLAREGLFAITRKGIRCVQLLP